MHSAIASEGFLFTFSRSNDCALVFASEITNAKRRKRKRSVGEVKFDGESYDVDDPMADHRSEGIRRSEANDHTGAVESFRAAVKFEKMDNL